MPPKKAEATGEDSEFIAGFTKKECRLLSAAFLSCIGPDKVTFPKL